MKALGRNASEIKNESHRRLPLSLLLRLSRWPLPRDLPCTTLSSVLFA